MVLANALHSSKYYDIILLKKLSEYKMIQTQPLCIENNFFRRITKFKRSDSSEHMRRKNGSCFNNCLRNCSNSGPTVTKNDIAFLSRKQLTNPLIPGILFQLSIHMIFFTFVGQIFQELLAQCFPIRSRAGISVSQWHCTW